MIEKEQNTLLEKTIDDRRYKITKFLTTIFLGTSLLALIIIIFVGIHTEAYLLSVSIILFVVLLLSYVRFVLLKTNTKLAYGILFSLLLAATLYNLMIFGTEVGVSYMIICVILLCIGFIYGINYIRNFTLFITLSVIIINLALRLQILPPVNHNEPYDIGDTTMILVWLWILGHVVKIGFEQIDHSYQQAHDYAKQLEELNKNLDEQVKTRTRQLRQNLEEQEYILHKSAIMGKIAQSMLHDLYTPVSTLKGSIDLMEKEKIDESTTDLIEIMRQSSQHIQQIIDDSRDMMSGQLNVTVFSPNTSVEKIRQLVQSKFYKSNIHFDNNLDPDFKLKGVSGLFERIILNLVINSIEELTQTEKDYKFIRIEQEEQGDKFIIYFEDNGRGIKPEYVEKIFNFNFSSKKRNGSNQGVGLAFVRSIVEKKFGGQISVDSVIGEYTKFKIIFDTKFYEHSHTGDPLDFVS